MDARGATLGQPGAGDDDATLQVRLLGGFAVRCGQEAAGSFDSPRLRSLLAYLLLHADAPQSRERIAFMLWPDSTEPQAKTNLRQLVHHLRRRLGEADRYLETTAQTLRWRPDAAVWCDAVEFERAADLAAGRDASAAELAHAADLYTADLLPEGYDDWVVEERERLRRRHTEILDRLVELLTEQRDYPRAVDFAERLLRRDPLREATYRRLMRLHLLRGERASAVRVYHACAGVLERELGVSPDPVTKALYASLLADRGTADVQPEPVSLAAPRARATLVGRAVEWDRVTEAWWAASSGSPSLLVVVGEAGIGKSRLLEEFAGSVARQGGATATTRAYVAEGDLAYAPLADWLRSDALRPRLAALDETARSDLARLLPELSTGRQEGIFRGKLSASEQRRRLFEAVVQVVCGVGRPVLLVLDDLQWCDRETLEFLHYLVRASTGKPVLVAGTARDEDIGAEHPLTAVLAGLDELGRLRRLSLGPLAEQHVGALAGELRAEPMSADAVHRLYQETEGNPLFVVETLRRDKEEGAAALPPRVRSVLEARLARLSPVARDLAGLAAVIGREFTYDVLQACGVVAQDLLIPALDELWRRRIIREHASGAYDFSHDKIREVAYATSGPARRRWLHLAVAQALLARQHDALDDIAGLVASHYDQAGAPAEAIRYYRLAAGAAQRLWASEQVIAVLRRAIELLGLQPECADRDATELAMQTELNAALVARRGHGSPEANAVYRRTRILCERLGRPLDPPLVRGLALGALVRRDFTEASALGADLVARGSGADDPVTVEGQYILGVTAFFCGRFRDAAEHLRLALAGYREAHRQEHLALFAQDPKAVCLSRLALTEWYLGEVDTALRTCAEAVAYGRQLGHRWTLGYVLMFAALLYAEHGDLAMTRTLVREAGPVTAEQEQKAELDLMVHILAGWVAVNDGDAATGIAQIRQGLDGFGRQQRFALETYGLTLLARAYRLAGDDTAAAATARHALEVTERFGQLCLQSELLCLTGELLARRDPEAAVRMLRRAVAVARDQHARTLELRAEQALREVGR